MDDLVKNRIAIIPARGGSKRLPNKNVMEFMGKPMIAWSINAALETGLFDIVLVSTDSQKIADIAMEFGATVPFLRDNHADDHSPVSEATLTALTQLEKFTGKKYKTVVQLMANCPLRSVKNIKEQVGAFEKQTVFNSIISGFKYGMFNPWWAHQKEENGSYKKVLDNYSSNVRSQDLPELICPTGAIWISSVSRLKEHKSFYSPNYSFHEISWIEAVDIDDVADLQLAKVAFHLKDEYL